MPIVSKTLSLSMITGSAQWMPPREEDIEQENTLMLRKQCLFRWAAQLIAIGMSQLPEIQKVAAFGAVARPLTMEIPRFSQFRRHRIKILRECRVRNCGAQPFLQQFERYRFNPAQFEGEPKVTLFDKASGFLVRAPRMDAKPARFVQRPREDDAWCDDEELPL